MWHFLHSTWGLVLVCGGVFATILGAILRPLKMLEAWNQYVYIFRDKAVFEAVDRGKWSAPLRMRMGGRDEVIGQPSRIPLTTKEIAVQLGRGEDSVGHSLERLKSAKKICNKLAGWMPTEH